ncbi:MAG: hypothetical protein F9K43_18530, partial [Bauldia sp.]
MGPPAGGVEASMRGMFRLLFMVVAVAGFVGAAASAPMEPNTDRPGADFTSFNLPAGSNPAQCQQMCEADGQCKAWTFVNPGVQSPQARCWLKSSVPAPQPDNCCTSGVRPQDAAFEPNTDRPGGDYVGIDIPKDWAPQACQAICNVNGKCKSWTYVNAGVQSSNPRCYLKGSVVAKNDNNCCTSGVKP